MQIWIRVSIYIADSLIRSNATSSSIVTKVRPQLGITVYPSEAAAEDAVTMFGGIALVTDSAKLKDLYLPEQISIDGKPELHVNGQLIHDACDSDVFHQVEPLMLSVDYATLPHTIEQEPVRAKDDPEFDPNDTQPVTVFSDEAMTWFAQLEEALGAFLHV